MGRTRRGRHDGWREARAERDRAKRRRREERERRRRDRDATELASWQGHGSCGRKVRFPTRQEAETWADGCGARFGPEHAGQVAYRCEVCGGWHLTAHPWHMAQRRGEGEIGPTDGDVE